MISPRRGSAPVETARWREGGRRTARDRVAVEEPMEIRLEVPDGEGGLRIHPVAVTMRTPGDDFELAAGFLFSEGLLRGRSDVERIAYCNSPSPQEFNVVSVTIRPGVPFDPALLTRNFYTTSSCGVCGKASLEAVAIRGCRPFTPGSGSRFDPEVLKRLPDALREGQGIFERTGGLHAAALVHPDGTFAALREDVGRHNAVDKVVGHHLLEGRLPALDSLLLVSGRTSFEILQKALAAGVPAVAAVGAPSSLAVDVARSFGMTLVGFLRDEGFNVYTGGERIGERIGEDDKTGRAGGRGP